MPSCTCSSVSNLKWVWHYETAFTGTVKILVLDAVSRAMEEEGTGPGVSGAFPFLDPGVSAAGTAVLP